MKQNGVYENIKKTNPIKIERLEDNVWAVTYEIKGHNAFTLGEDDVSSVHEDGWEISGKVHEDYFTWVNEFEATKNGEKVWGDFEKVVYCTSLEVLEDFLENHFPDAWDYYDI